MDVPILKECPLRGMIDNCIEVLFFRPTESGSSPVPLSPWRQMLVILIYQEKINLQGKEASQSRSLHLLQEQHRGQRNSAAC